MPPLLVFALPPVIAAGPLFFKGNPPFILFFIQYHKGSNTDIVGRDFFLRDFKMWIIIYITIHILEV